MTRWLRALVALLAALGALAVAPDAQAQTFDVGRIRGPQGRAIARRLTRAMTAAGFTEGDSPELEISGRVRRRGWRLVLSLELARNGDVGRVEARERTPRALVNSVVEEIRMLVPQGAGAEPQDEPEPDEPDEPDASADEPAEPTGPAVTPGGANPLDDAGDALEVWIGGGVVGRAQSFRGDLFDQVGSYRLDAAPQLNASARWFPLRHFSNDPMLGIGIQASAWTAIGLSSERAGAEDVEDLGTTMYEASLGVLYRLPLLDLLVIEPGFDYVESAFRLTAPGPERFSDQVEAVPDVTYQQLRPRVAVELVLPEGLGVRADVAWLAVSERGGSTTTTGSRARRRPGPARRVGELALRPLVRGAPVLLPRTLHQHAVAGAGRRAHRGRRARRVDARRRRAGLHCPGDAMRVGLAALLLLTACSTELGPCDESAARQVVYDESGSPAFEGQALMIGSCGSGGFCHSPGIDPADRRGVPVGLDYDVRLAEDADAATERLRVNQALTFQDRHRIWVEVTSGRMPVPGDAGEEILTAAPTYSRYDSLSGTATALPALDTEDGAEILRNWLACRVPVVERTEPVADVEPIGAVVSRRDVVPLEANWADIYTRMIEPRCASAPCHGRSAAADLELSDQAMALAAMTNVAAAGDDCMGAGMLIVPGDPDASLFVHKLSGRDAADAPVCGDLMPGSGSRIDGQSIANIRQWIMDGANP